MLLSNIEERDRGTVVTLWVQCRGWLIVNLKAIKSKENIFCYLSSHIRLSASWPQGLGLVLMLQPSSHLVMTL